MLSIAAFVLATMSAERLTAAAVSQLIASKGAAAALEQISRDHKYWAAVLRGIASGSKSWLAVANLLQPASDAGSGEMLELAVGEALEHHPANVLRIALPVFGINVCSGPDVDDPRFDSYERSIRAIDERIRMLATVRDRALLEPRNRCIEQLRSSRSGIAQFYGRDH